ncbi:MAG: 3-carboxy-cis,cis-muconate cycloisomerase [Corynebacterium sp.]|uniref:3-carboxy-cis,cis-muconate cycloisomerase n=1 Tax=Corynebacterium sp. TaxID=1720 RepID=UPI0026DF2B03|nr:3-carboxy-cis,cis-muconate cycloisomerase [Corynebacterium sp.]MDO5669974.1 3-carboxy-cis,cis-muconate cycloisomerase [Corynebacterium sp.]
MSDLSRNSYSDVASGDTAVHAHLSDRAFLAAICEFEKMLADAAAAAGHITDEAARTANDVIDSYEIDVEAIAAASAAGGNPTIPIVAELKKRAGDAAGIHVGATSQDAIDTAVVLCLRRAGRVLDGQLGDVEKLLAELATTHRDTPVMGRTLGQQALPTTFGVIAAGWWEAVHESARQLGAALEALPVQYAGATGNLVATHPRGIDVHDRLAASLGLASRPLVWHTNRLPIVSVGLAAAQVAGAVRKIAGDIIAYSASEITELAEATPGGSSSMPHKANPAAAVACDGYARRTPGLAASMLDTLDSRWQRGVGSWHAEWQTIRELLATTASAVNRIHASLDGLRVHTDTMAQRVTGHHTGHAAEITDLILEGDTHD